VGIAEVSVSSQVVPFDHGRPSLALAVAQAVQDEETQMAKPCHSI
jgi:hypothetical protein